jgi:hypothetical protein
MVLSDYAKQRILSLFWHGYKISAIVDHLMLEDEIVTTRQSVRLFVKRYEKYGTIARKPGSGLPPSVSPAIQELIDRTMREDDETTATQLQSKLASYNVYVSLSTILRNRLELGWTYRGSAYCQLIRQQNKQKRAEWAEAYLQDNFDGLMKLLFSWIHTDGIAIVKKEKNHA